jgi:hypothetical protein
VLHIAVTKRHLKALSGFFSDCGKLRKSMVFRALLHCGARQGAL